MVKCEMSGDHLNSSGLFVYWPLLFSSTVSRNRMENELREFHLLNPDLQHLRILLQSLVGAGKSSFINSINSVFQGRACTGALAAESSGASFTKKVSGSQMWYHNTPEYYIKCKLSFFYDMKMLSFLIHF